MSLPSRSIRSFALDYYRKRGAEITQLEGDEAFEIREEGEAPLTVTFADDADRKRSQVNATSPQWRAILEDLTAEVAVSYRYLAAGPIARPARTIEALLPPGFVVQQARLLGVENRIALGFTHRVTFDSPALNACTEEIHHHLWDVADERRMLDVEPRLYELPFILIRPEVFPDEATVQGLLGRTLAVVDLASDTRGREIERELGTMLSEAEKRTNQYFDQQMGNVLGREAALAEKLDVTVRRLLEARSPEVSARAKTEGDSLARQLEHMKANRERELALVEAACEAKLATERERHELTATTELAALCHASYDIASYRIELVGPDGHAASWVVKYCPVAQTVSLPACERCGKALESPVALGQGRFACAACCARCVGCGTAHADAAELLGCEQCEATSCLACTTICRDCGEPFCGAHTRRCASCDAPTCARCAGACASCEAVSCEAHREHDAAGVMYCVAHLPEAVAAIETYAIIEETVALAELEREANVPQAATPAAADAPGPEAQDLAEVSIRSIGFIPAEEAAMTMGYEPFDALDVDAEWSVIRRIPPGEPAPDAALMPALSLAASTYFKVDDTADAHPAMDSTLAALFGGPAGRGAAKQAPVYSRVSGAAMHPALAETCPSCLGHCSVQEMVDCATCGLPACMPCAGGKTASCPACDALAPVKADDRRLKFVFAQFPELARGRRWEVASVGPYVLAHWSRLGTWGMVVYHTEPEPVVTTSFRAGRWETLKQAFGQPGGRA